MNEVRKGRMGQWRQHSKAWWTVSKIRLTMRALCLRYWKSLLTSWHAKMRQVKREIALVVDVDAAPSLCLRCDKFPKRFFVQQKLCERTHWPRSFKDERRKNSRSEGWMEATRSLTLPFVVVT